MNRKTALRAIGLSEDAEPNRVREGYEVMRAHLEDRARRGGDPQLRERSERELRELADALGLDTSPAKPGLRDWRPGTTLVAASVAALCVAGAVFQLQREPFAVPDAAEPAERVPEPEPLAAEAPPPPPPDPDAPPGWILVQADVPGALLVVRPDRPEQPDEGPAPVKGFADGRAVELPPGPYELSVFHPDCGIGWETRAEVVSGEEIDFEARPCPRTGWAVVRSNQSGDRLRINGRDRGPTGPSRHALPAGEHRFRVEKPGFRAWEQTVEIPPAEVTTLRARLDPGAGPSDEAPPFAEELGGSHGWFNAVSGYLVGQYDRNESGLIDTRDEVASIDCPVLQAIERSYESGGLGAPMSRLYGFDGSRWVEDALGFDVRVRGDAYERMRSCGLR